MTCYDCQDPTTTWPKRKDEEVGIYQLRLRHNYRAHRLTHLIERIVKESSGCIREDSLQQLVNLIGNSVGRDNLLEVMR